MSNFNTFYATYYDFLYKGKDYAGEADFFHALIKKYGPKKPRTILSFGAGTLNHEKFLLQKGYEIDGVELSSSMVKLGKEKIIKEKLKKITLVKGDMRTFSTKHTYDAVTAMFNIVAYCQGLKDIEHFMKGAGKALNTGGVLVFDCWNAAVAQKDPPQNTWAKIKIGNKSLYKMVTSSQMYSNNSFVRSVELMVIDGSTVLGKQTERHTLFTWNVSDLEKIASRCGFSIRIVSEFMNIKPINNTRWSMVVVAQKK